MGRRLVRLSRAVVVKPPVVLTTFSLAQARQAHDQPCGAGWAVLLGGCGIFASLMEVDVVRCRV